MNNKIVSEFINTLESQRKFLANLEHLSNEQINWKPFDSKNSIGILLEHLIGSEKFWIQQVISGKNVKRTRKNEFIDRERSLEQILSDYKENIIDTNNVLSNLKDERLLEIVQHPERQVTILWVLIHVIEHNYYHIGQINLILAIMH